MQAFQKKEMQPPSTSFDLELVNFCLQPLAKVTSSSVAADNYPVTNLVSTNPLARLRGFRVEHFIRPPVQLDFEFRLPVNIAYITIQPDLPPTSEMRLELAGSFHTSLISSNLTRICPGAVVKDNHAALVLENKSFKRGDGRAISISEENTTPSQDMGRFVRRGGNCLMGTAPAKQPLKHPAILQRLRQLRLTVSRVSGPKPVSLRSVEVWGTPSNSCSPVQLNLLQTSLTGVPLQASATNSGGVNLYSSRKSCPEQGAVADHQDSITPNDLHSSCVDTDRVCSSDASYWKTSRDGGEVSEVDSGLALQMKEECQSAIARAERRSVFGVAGSGHSKIQEVFHIKATTSENKKSLKPQQSLVASHFQGCSHNNIIQNGGKPSATQVNNCLPQGKNGNPSFSSELAHNSGRVNHDEDSSRSSCGLRSHMAARDQQQQRLRQAQSAFIEERDIPPELLDKITYDVMQVPMLLPSGHYVDRRTLEKLSNNDALYGRPPTDPFTGTQMTDSIRAVCRCESCICLLLRTPKDGKNSPNMVMWCLMILCGWLGWSMHYCVVCLRCCCATIITNINRILLLSFMAC